MLKRLMQECRNAGNIFHLAHFILHFEIDPGMALFNLPLIFRPYGAL
jgi:hypothetical protein